MTVVITAASGKVGSALLRRLAADGGRGRHRGRPADAGRWLRTVAAGDVEGCDIGAVDATERLDSTHLVFTALTVNPLGVL